MRHSGRVPLLVLLTACSCKDCNGPNPPLEDEHCIATSRQTPLPQSEVCDELCPPGRRVSWRPVATALCEDFGPWTASRPNEGSFEPLEWWEIASIEAPTLVVNGGEIPVLLSEILEDLADVEPGTEVISVLAALEGFVLSPEEEDTILELIERAVATATAIDPASVCVHVWTGAGDPVNPPPDTEPDCLVSGEAVAPQQIETELAEAFQSSIGMPGLEEVSTPDLPQGPVMIAVVDTAPPGSGFGGYAVHGRAIASIIEQVACGATPPGSCTQDVEAFLGLPRILSPDGPLKSEGGGYFGYQTDLTFGIQAALNEWKSRSDAPKLVVNLSVGWEPSCSARSRTVEPVVEQAVNEGALVLAASGNRRLGSCIDGPVAPANWDDLVHAVTPVDDQLGELVTFRPGSNARIAAHGFMAVTSSGTASYGPMSGSSVATAVLSGIAARVWSHRSSLTADEVMDLLWESGEPRPGPVMADFYRGSESPPQHVVTACRALATALNMLEDSPLFCKNPTRPDVRELWGTNPIITGDVVELNIEEVQTADVKCPWCGGATLDTKVFGSPPVPALPDPWSVPQPDNPPCRMCGISVKTSTDGTSSSTARLIRDSYYQSMELVSTTITLWDAAERSRVVQYDASVLPLEDGTVYEVTSSALTNLDGAGSKPVRGYVTMVFVEGSQELSVGNEIPVWED